MPSDVTNAHATFCAMMNQVFHEYLDQCIVVYLDDIAIFSSRLEEHQVHLRLVFDKLRHNQLYVRERSVFLPNNISIFWVIIEYGKIQMNENKLRAIPEWRAPTL